MADNRIGWWSKIETADDARRNIKYTSGAFLIVAALQAALGVLVLHEYSMLVDAVAFAIAAFFLRRYSSRAAAIILLVLALGGAAMTVANRLGYEDSGGKNIFLSIIMVWAGVRAVMATYKLRSLATHDAKPSVLPGA
jgi:hypothetical protein